MINLKPSQSARLLAVLKETGLMKNLTTLPVWIENGKIPNQVQNQFTNLVETMSTHENQNVARFAEELREDLGL